MRSNDGDTPLSIHDPYIVSAPEVARWVALATTRKYRPRVSRKSLELSGWQVDIHDLLELEDSPYANLANGMTGRPHGEEREKHPLRPAMLRLLAAALKEPRTRTVVDEVLVALRAAGVEERKWALAMTLHLAWGCTHEEIARETHCDRSTVSRHIAWATEWITTHLAEAGLLDELAPRAPGPSVALRGLGDVVRPYLTPADPADGVGAHGVALCDAHARQAGRT